MVIYRAPTIYLEPGFFVEEPGSYFETQNGTCVPDPCPQLPSLNSPIPAQALCGPKTLDYGLPDNIPGVFYTWSPEQYFSNPWSNKTDFIPPSGNGCINAKLTIWSICGPSQSYDFPVKYYEPSVPQVSISNIQLSQSKIVFKANFDNVQIWLVVVTNISTGEIIYQSDGCYSCLRNKFNFSNCNS
jgi:hypothetical protein